MSAVEVVLMIRSKYLGFSALRLISNRIVYALYNQNRWISYSFVGLILVETLTTIIGVVLTLPKDFSSTFFLIQNPASFTYFGYAPGHR